MARRPRGDEPGSWHHVVNRGIARRPLFEARSDMRFFLARLARQVRLERIELHAFCLMTTHFHLLVRSLGALSEAMRRVQNEHSRRFNRRQRRDGSLVRGRFFSKPVDTLEYRRLLIRYIDANPVRAGMVRSSGEYEFGSASAYLDGRGPPWLSREWVEAEACSAAGRRRYTPTCYRAAFGPGNVAELDDLDEIIEARLASTSLEDAADDLIGATPERIRAWMKRKAKLADGHSLGLQLCGHRALRRALDEQGEVRGPWMVKEGRKTWRGEELAWIGLLRGLCAFSWPEVATVSGFSESRSHRLGRAHRRLLDCHPEYSSRVAEVGHRALARGESSAQPSGSANPPGA
jgi:REP element-mobilizing transposase RayT